MNADKKRMVVASLLDKAGMWTSALCALHCVALPMLVTISSLGGLVILDTPVVENTLFGVSVLLGTSSLFPSYFKHHRRLYPILILLSGFFLIGLSRFMVNESMVVSLGATLLASAHFFNYSLFKKWHSKI
ncbi:MAG: MerC domain-containing protein [Bacteroidota bacterium]